MLALLVLLQLLALALAAPTSVGNVVFPVDHDWWVINATNQLVFNWTASGGEPVTTLYNLDTKLMASPFFWENQFYVNPGINTVKSSAALVGASPGDGYYIAIDVQGTRITSPTFEIKAAGSVNDTVPVLAKSNGAGAQAPRRGHLWAVSLLAGLAAAVLG